jgi:amino acid transporter
MTDALIREHAGGGSVPATAGTEAEIVERAGYRPELRRTLRLFSMFAIAFSIISITTGIFLNYAFGLNYFGPASIWTWPIVGVGNLMIAFIVAELGTRIPLAGYAYQWSARLVNSSYGWFVGFAGLLYMTVGGGSIMLLVAAPLMLSEFNVNSATHPHLNLAVAIVLMLVPVVFNVISAQVAARVNNIAVFTEILGTVVFGVLLFVLWGLQTKHTPYGANILTNTTSSIAAHPVFYRFALAGLLGAYTLVGFELAADMSEDAVDPRRTVPKGVIWAVAGSAILGMIALIGFTVAIPNLKAVETVSAAGGLPLLTIAQFWLPAWLVKVFVGFVIFSMFAILVVGAGAQARLAYSLARDNMLPFSSVLKRVHPKTQTPIVALLVFAVIDVGAMIYGYFQTSAFLTLVGATAILPYIIYFLITVAYARKRRTTDAIPGVFNLGRFAWPVIGFVLVYSLAIMLDLSVPSIFFGSDKVLFYGFGVAVLWYVTVLYWRLKHNKAGVTPVEDFMKGGR